MRRIDIHLRNDERYDIAIRAVKAADPVDYAVIELEQQNRRMITVFLRDGTSQTLMDNLQDALEPGDDWRITLLPIEATVPKLEEASKRKKAKSETATREELYADVIDGAQLTTNYIVLVVLSTVVAAIGLNSNGVAAVIGAMVIAPLLGPILGLAMGAALGDQALLRRGVITLGAGVGVALGVALLLAFVMPIDFGSRELMSRAEVRLDGLALAMAAGGAAALSLVRGQGMALVGVMVAAALLPPIAAIGLFAGAGELALASRASLLLALNIASLVLSALIVFYITRVRPRSWIEQKHADRAVWINIILAGLMLVVSAVLIIVLDLGAEVSIG